MHLLSDLWLISLKFLPFFLAMDWFSMNNKIFTIVYDFVAIPPEFLKCSIPHIKNLVTLLNNAILLSQYGIRQLTCY